MTLTTIVNEFKIRDGVLKVDCEGCEYEIIKIIKSLKNFTQILIEYHKGPQPLVTILEDLGYQVTLRPRNVPGIGYILASL